MALTDPTSQCLALSLVLDKLLEPIDIVRFGAVCRQWHSSAKFYLQTNPKRNHKPLPMLMIPPPLESDEGKSTRRRVYSLSETKMYDNIHLSLPSYTKRCCGSSYGWLATVEDERLAITLRNPFCQSIDPIRLPPLDFLLVHPVPPHHKASGLYEHYIAKVVLSADPILSPDDYVVAVIYDVYTRLAFIKIGQTSWTIVTAEEDDDYLFPTDILFHRGKLYAVGMCGYILAVDCNDHDSNNNKAQGRTLDPNKEYAHRASTRDYLVESTKGDLFLLRRLIEYDKLPILETFHTFRLVLDDEENNVVQHFPVPTIGDDEAFFVGNNQSVAVLASNYPCIEPDCIYYTDDLTFRKFRTGPDDSRLQRAEIGVFRLSKLCTPTPYKNLNIDWQLRNPPALWIVPSINMSV